MYPNTLIQTTHFLKKCVIQPISEKKKSSELKEIRKLPFKRGAMGFEDYNYASYNPYIFVENKH